MEQNLENALANLVRVGIVSSVNPSKKQARVIFKDKDNMVSGWLSVLQRSGTGVNVIPDGEHTHIITDTYTGSGDASTEPDHNHPGTTVTTWMPKVNDTVLVVYLPIFNADGFILGAI